MAREEDRIQAQRDSHMRRLSSDRDSDGGLLEEENANQNIIDENQQQWVADNRATELNHASCILTLSYTEFDWTEIQLLNFHRPRIEGLF